VRLSRYLFLGSMLSILNGCGNVTATSADSGSTGAASDCVGPGCQAPSQSKDDYELAVDLGAGGSSSSSTVTGAPSAVSVCGAVSVGCNPDVPDTCAHVALDAAGGTGAGPAGAGGVGGASGATSAAGAGGAATASGGAESGLGGSAAVLVDLGSTAVGGAASNSAPSSGGTSTELACRVVLVNEVAMTTCELAGTRVDNEPCTDRWDCAAGFACVEESGGARCRHYCCGGNAKCEESGTFCEERDLSEATNVALKGRSKPRASVCMPGVPCRLDEPYPCPSDVSCTCPSGKACGVVRSDGTTACITPGAGQDGDACPCAAGYVCSETLGQCLKACSLQGEASSQLCPSGVCQSSPNLPTGFGICVSADTLI
jgi:hypothetical protein